MEKIPNQESKESLYDNVLELVKTRGLTDPEVIEVYSRWYEMMEQYVEEVSDVLGSRKRQIDFLISQSNIYREGGDKEEASSILNEAMMIAQMEGLDI